MAAFLSHLFLAGNVCKELDLRLSRTVCLILRRVHGVFKQLLVVFSYLPMLFVHHLTVLVERVGIVVLRVAGEELASFGFRFLDNLGSKLSGQSASLSEDHVPYIVGNHAPTLLALLHLHHVHQREVLHILAERCYKWRITDARPYIRHLVEQLYQQLVLRHQRLVVLYIALVYCLEVLVEVCHKATHHTARKSRTYQERIHQSVSRTDIQTQKVVHELLYHAAHFHVGFHVYLRHAVTGILQHCLHCQEVGMPCSPREWLHTHVDVIASCSTHFEDGCHIEARTGMAMILYRYLGMRGFDACNNLPERVWTTDSCHILYTYLVGTQADKLESHLRVVFHGMDGGVGDAERALRNHPCFFGVADTRRNVAHIVKSAKRAGYVCPLRLLHLIKQLAHICRDRAHTKSVEGTVEHVGLDACLMERLRPFTHGFVGVFSEEKVDLFEPSSVGFDAGKTTHFNDGRCNTCELIYARHVFPCRLPHIAEDQAEFYFSFHDSMFILSQFS